MWLPGASSSGNAAGQERLPSNGAIILSSKFYRYRHMLLLEMVFLKAVIISRDADDWLSLI